MNYRELIETLDLMAENDYYSEHFDSTEAELEDFETEEVVFEEYGE